MSQILTVFGIDWKMLVIETINFLILLAGLSYFLYKPVLKMLSDRAEIVAKGVKDAEEAARALKESETAKVSILSSAEREAEKIVATAVVQGKDERAQIVKKAQAQSDATIAGAQAQATELQRRALAESQKDIARMAVLAAEHILKES